LHETELILTPVNIKLFKQRRTLAPPVPKKIPDDATLYFVPYFPESLQEFESAYAFSYFFVNWDDKNFLADIRKLIKPRGSLELIQPPQDKISIAVHIRRNSNGLDNPMSFASDKQANRTAGYFDCLYPFKCVNDDFYIAGIKMIHELFHGQPLYVYLFTDDAHPEKIAEKYQRSLDTTDIVFDFHKDKHDHTIHVLEDFFSMLTFDCMIRSDSSFSVVASKLGDYKVIISPAGYRLENDIPAIVRANISITLGG
jgi:hypothetical protein